jgi:hypothetical protein
MPKLIVSYRELRRRGWSRARLREGVESGHVDRVSRGRYAAGPAGPGDRLRALCQRLPEGAVVGHRSAAALYGFADPPRDGIHVLLPAGVVRPKIRGVVTHEAVLPVGEPSLLAGVPVAPAARCAVDLARTSRRFDGIAVLDAALRVGACTAATLADEVARHGGLRGVRQARELVAVADGRSECPQESHLRLLLIDAGLPAPQPQVWVLDGEGIGRHRIDLAYRRQRVGLEYDGRSHVEPGRLPADRARLNWLASQGWTMRYFTADDLYGRPEALVATVRAALRRRS